jgi:hypothetical protein
MRKQSNFLIAVYCRQLIILRDFFLDKLGYLVTGSTRPKEPADNISTAFLDSDQNEKSLI